MKTSLLVLANCIRTFYYTGDYPKSKREQTGISVDLMKGKDDLGICDVSRILLDMKMIDLLSRSRERRSIILHQKYKWDYTLNRHDK